MKATVSTIKLLLFIFLTGGCLVIGSMIVKKQLFSSAISTEALSKEVITLNNKINSISPNDVFEKRIELLKEIDDFTKKSVNGNSFSPNIYSLVKVRLDQALKEIPQTQVPKGKVKIWYIYNMGVIAKSENKTIAFDLAGTYIYSNMLSFARYIDILVISHFDGDHFDLPVVKEALKNGVIVIIPGDKMIFKGQEFGRDPQGEDAVSLIKKRDGIDSNNLISLKPQEKTIIKGVEMIAYPAKHLHNYDEESSFINPPVNWYYVNLSGITLLHTGDGVSFDYQPDFINKNIDVYMIHSTTLDPMTNDSLMKLVPHAKTILPLHVLELGHGPTIVGEKNNWYMNYQNILDNYSKGYYKGAQEKAKFIPIIWGESLLF